MKAIWVLVSLAALMTSGCKEIELKTNDELSELMKSWDGEETIVSPPQTRAQIMFELFEELAEGSFVYNDLVGIWAELPMRHTMRFLDFPEMSVTISHINVVVLYIEHGWTVPLTKIYDNNYSDRLDKYIVALQEAVDAKKEVERLELEAELAQRMKEETQF